MPVLDFDNTANQKTDKGRAHALFCQHRLTVYQQTDRVFAILMPMQWLAGIAAAYFVSPYTWAGTESRVHPHVWVALWLGGVITLLPMILVLRRPGTLLTRNMVAISQMLMTGLLIHLSGGRIETHFHVFGSLAFLAFYRDWRVLIPATAVTALDHLLRGWAYPLSVYGVLTGGEWRWIEHAGWVIFIDIFLLASCYRSEKEMWEIAQRTAEVDASEERYRAVVKQTNEGIALIEPETLRIIECNEAFSRLLGCAGIEEAQTLTVYDFSTTERMEIERLRIKVLVQDDALSTEHVYRRRDGSTLQVEVNACLISYDGKQAFCLNVKDITERKRAEEELRRTHEELEFRVAARTRELVQANEIMQLEAHERQRAQQELTQTQQFLRKVIENVPSMIFVKDSTGRFTLANQAVAEIYGTSVENLIGKTDADFNANADEVEQIRRDDEEVLKNLQEKFIHEERVTDAGGQAHWLQTIKRPLLLGEGKTLLLGIATDLTERKALENQLRNAQKLESIGQLAAGIAHEINTPTQYVGDNARFVRDAFHDINAVLEKFTALLTATRAGSPAPELLAEVEAEIQNADLEYLSEEVPHAIEQALEGVSRIAKIVQSMKDFAHPGGSEKKEADLNKAIESTLTVARNEWKYVAELETHFDPELPSVPCFLGEFNQVILNMTINAAHAIADVVGDGARGKGKITVTTARRGDEWVEVRIADTGKGIPPEVQGRIFDPFFTTKEVGKGTGQGLAISHAVVVDKHKGQLEFETEVGRGTTFIIRLPLESTSNSN